VYTQIEFMSSTQVKEAFHDADITVLISTMR
jgi:hypothetical protein